jgi:hypothetical protein
MEPWLQLQASLENNFVTRGAISENGLTQQAQ